MMYPYLTLNDDTEMPPVTSPIIHGKTSMVILKRNGFFQRTGAK